MINHYIEKAGKRVLSFSTGDTLDTLEAAVRDFNTIDIHEKEYPRVGIIGEIYAKHNPFGNNNIAEWLMDRGFEVFVPPLLPVLMQGFVDIHTNHATNVMSASFLKRSLFLFYEKKINRGIHESNTLLKKLKIKIRPLETIREIAQKAAKMISLNIQAGEGWTIPGDVGLLAESGVKSIVCLQPFGCLATHIAGKGLRKQMYAGYPDIDILFLDIDPGDSKVNIFNRLYIFLDKRSTTIP